MKAFERLDSLVPVWIEIDYTNPKLNWNTEWLNPNTFWIYKTFIWKFRTILDNWQDAWYVQQWHHRVHLSPAQSIVKIWDNLYFYKGIKWSGFSNQEDYISKKDWNWQVQNSNATLWGIPEIIFKNISQEYDWWYEILWCFDDRVFSKLKNISNILNENWARIETIAKSWLLKEVIYKWAKTSVEELKEKGIIPNDSNLKIRQIERLSRSRFRIKDFCNLKWKEKLEAFIETLELLNKENSLKSINEKYSIENLNDSTHKYLIKTAESLAKNLAIFLTNGLSMGYMNSWNITMSIWEIVDLDSIKELSDTYKPENINLWHQVKHYEDSSLPKETVKDIRDVTYAFNMLIKSMSEYLNITSELRKKLWGIFLESFNKNYLHKRRLNVFYEHSDLLKTINNYINNSIIWGKNTPTIK